MKKRNAQALAAWSRHGGAHQQGSKKPERDEREEIDEALEAAVDEFVDGLLGGTIEVDGERLEIEFEWEDDDDEE